MITRKCVKDNTASSAYLDSMMRVDMWADLFYQYGYPYSGGYMSQVNFIDNMGNDCKVADVIASNIPQNEGFTIILEIKKPITSGSFIQMAYLDMTVHANGNTYPIILQLSVNHDYTSIISRQFSGSGSGFAAMSNDFVYCHNNNLQVRIEITGGHN